MGHLLPAHPSDAGEFAIIGGGIGGLATAIALQALGLEARVFERASELREIGAGLLLSPNGVAALEFLGVRAEAQKTSRVQE